MIVTPNGHELPLSVKNGLCYLQLSYPTDEDMRTLPRIIFTSDDEWDPSLITDLKPVQERLATMPPYVPEKRILDYTLDGDIIFDAQRVQYLAAKDDADGVPNSPDDGHNVNDKCDTTVSESSPVLEVKLLSQDAIAPTKGCQGAAGFDLYAVEDVVIPPMMRRLVRTDIAIAVPPETYAHIASQSGTSLRNGIETGTGVVDLDYRGPVGVILYNFDQVQAHKVCKGDSIAQLILEKIVNAKIETVDCLDLTIRGDKGFGSTGTNHKQVSHVGAIGTDDVNYITNKKLLEEIEQAKHQQDSSTLPTSSTEDEKRLYDATKDLELPKCPDDVPDRTTCINVLNSTL